MHKYFKKFSTPEEARRNPYNGVSQEDWNYLVNLFSSEIFKKISEINKKNRSKSRLNHIGGTKSFARSRYDKRDPLTGKLFPRPSLWRETYGVDEKARLVLEEVENLSSTPQEDGSILSEDESFSRVLGEKSGYVRGLVAGPKPKTMSMLKYNQTELDKEFDSRLQSMRTEIQVQMEAQVEARVEVRVQARMSQMQSDFEAELQGMRATFEQQIRLLLSPG